MNQCENCTRLRTKMFGYEKLMLISQAYPPEGHGQIPGQDGIGENSKWGPLHLNI